MGLVSTVSYQCPNCNAALEFDTATGKFRCFYCDSTFTETEIKNIFAARDENIDLSQNEPELSAADAEMEEFTGQSALYNCPNCGAGVICDSLAASTRCHFCHTPVILAGRLSGEFKPDLIIPFQTTLDQAKQRFYDYTKRKFLLPKGFTSKAQINNISALYVPYWLKSGTVNAGMDAVGKMVRTWRVGDTRYTHTKVFHIEREADFEFMRVPCDGSKRIDDSLMESIEPFMYNGVRPFNMSYLSGCAAEKYDVTKEDASGRINERVLKAAEEELRKLASSYNAIESVSTNIRFINEEFAYALLPVWFLNYTYKGKDYGFVVNGQTGMTFGVLPVSRWRLFLYRAGIFLIATVIAFLIGGLLLAGD